jgi:non-heme chloroperoxidase
MHQTVSRTRFATTSVATGVDLHYAEQGEPGAEVILFLHGWPDSWYSHRRVLELLPPGEHHAFAVDQRGFGGSGRPDHGYAIDDYAADAVAFLDAAGIERATVVGHSFGSFVARRMARVAPGRVQDEFVARVQAAGVACTVRNTRGREIAAACGQLAAGG